MLLVHHKNVSVNSTNYNVTRTWRKPPSSSIKHLTLYSPVTGLARRRISVASSFDKDRNVSHNACNATRKQEVYGCILVPEFLRYFSFYKYVSVYSAFCRCIWIWGIVMHVPVPHHKSCDQQRVWKGIWRFHISSVQSYTCINTGQFLISSSKWSWKLLTITTSVLSIVEGKSIF